MKLNKRFYAKKFDFLGTLFSFIFILLIIYAANLQIINNNQFKNEVKINIIKQRKLPAPRGAIFDRNNVLLASIEYQNDLYIIPHYFHDDINLICNSVKVDCNLIKYKIKQYPLNRILIASNIDDLTSYNLRQISGLYIFRFSKRQYNIDTATSHIIGYVGRINQEMLETDNSDGLYADNDIVGQSGIEYIYNRELHGINGAEQYIVMANGLEVTNPNRFLSINDYIITSIAGNNLYLSIDDNIQLIFANNIGFKRGAAVMMDIHNGAILALYSSPNFNPKQIKSTFTDKNFPLINRSINSYAPGSTFKVVTALAALELELVDPLKKEDCPGFYSFGGRIWHCWKHGKLGNGHGKIDLHDAIKQSCDVYFYKLAQKVGLKNINKYAKMLGFGEFTGIDLNNESAGHLPSIKSTPGTLLNTVIGQGTVQATPLQMANAYATIINGGELRSPRIVAYGDIPFILKKNYFKKGSVRFLMNALYSVVNEEGGTGYYSKSSTIVLAGKTGTAQVAGLDKKKTDNAWFVAYYPVVEPQIVVCVFVEQGAHGSSVIPIVNKAIEEYAKKHPAATLMNN